MVSRFIVCISLKRTVTCCDFLSFKRIKMNSVNRKLISFKLKIYFHPLSLCLLNNHPDSDLNGLKWRQNTGFLAFSMQSVPDSSASILRNWHKTEIVPSAVPQFFCLHPKNMVALGMLPRYRESFAIIQQYSIKSLIIMSRGGLLPFRYKDSAISHHFPINFHQFFQSNFDISLLYSIETTTMRRKPET